MNDENRLHAAGASTTLGTLSEIRNLSIEADAALSLLDQFPASRDSVGIARERLGKAIDLINDLEQLEKPSPDTCATTTTGSPRKPLPEDTGRTLGPGHLDMVCERISQAIGISQMMHAAIHNRGNLMEGAEDAAWGQERLLREADEHLVEYLRERADTRRQEATRQPLHENAINAAVLRMKRIDNRLSELGATDDDHKVLDDAVALLEGRAAS